MGNNIVETTLRQNPGFAKSNIFSRIARVVHFHPFSQSADFVSSARCQIHGLNSSIEVSVTSDRSLLVQVSCICSEVILKGSVLRSVGLQVSLRVVKATLAMGGCQCVAPLMHIFFNILRCSV